MALTDAAWVPDDDDERDWNDAAALAVAWLEDHCQAEGVQGLLVTNTLDSLNVPELDAFARRNEHTSPRARWRAPVGVPVLSYVPDADSLEFAMTHAGSSSICVVEGSLFRMTGWAARLEATDLVNGESTPALSDEMLKALDRLKFHASGGFHDPFAKRTALSIVAELPVEQHPLLPSGLMAVGGSAPAAKQLQALIDGQA